ncbi:MAG: DUF5615 family PIN-like protein [Vicinamibacteria bacterium]|nr:DUF5615 family PIN-like protein [Vicinamibacteria bacterium]
MPRFPLLTDENVDGPIVSALSRAGWEVHRAVDAVGERSDDSELLALAARQGWVVATTDTDHLSLVGQWSSAPIPRVVFWKNSLQHRLRPGAWVTAFEALAQHPAPFGSSPVVFLSLPGA